jgi:dihydrofolate synthase/folylpolyglutamate synthase
MNAALLYFKEKNVEYALIETGIGGLLDCTNTLTPIVSVITKIGYDHMDILGNSLQEIAAHKAGIIKENIPVVTDPTQSDEAMKVIRETAARKNAQLIIPKGKADDYQGYNKIVAKETLRILGITEYNFSDFSKVQLLGRMQIISKKPLIITDGAHNPDAIRAISQSIAKLPHTNKTIVIGTQKSKDRAGCIKELSHIDHSQLIIVEDVSCKIEVKSALIKAKKLSGDNGMILICGSLYLAGTALQILEPVLTPGDLGKLR